MPTTSCRAARKAGTSPNSSDVSSEIPSPKSRTRWSRETSKPTGNWSRGTIASWISLFQEDSTIPAAPPTTASRSPSVSSCCTSRLRVAPRASRTAISRPRADARASSRLATLVQASSRIRPAAPIASAALSTRVSRGAKSGSSKPVPPEMSSAPRSRLVAGYVCSSRAAKSPNLEEPAARSRPGRSRPATVSQVLSRSSRIPSAPLMTWACIIIGTQRSGWNPNLRTPCVPRRRHADDVNGWPLSRTTVPRTPGSPPNRSCHRRWLTTISGSEPGPRASAGVKVRPSTGRSPNAEK